MKKQAKRFDDGGDVADKIAGLAASNAEMERNPPSSMLDRIKQSLGRFGEGNIDDPKSEAYRKYGAGKAKSMRAADRMEAEANANTVGTSTPSVKPSADYGDYIPESNSNTVTPSSLAAAAAVKKVKPSRTGAYDQEGGKAVLDAMRKNSVTDTGDETARLAARYPAPKGMAAEAARMQNLRNDFGKVRSSDNKDAKKGDDPRGTLQYKMASEAVRARMRDAAGVSEFKKGGAIKKMASGGATSSASRRGDGIAQRGKTRGKYC